MTSPYVGGTVASPQEATSSLHHSDALNSELEAQRPPHSPSSPCDAAADEPCLVGDRTAKEATQLHLDLSPAQRKRKRLHRIAYIATLVVCAITAFVAATAIVQLSHPPLGPDAFKYRSYSEIVDSMRALETKYPQFVEVFSAQERYGLPLRDELKCSGANNTRVHCQHYVIKITDKATLPDAHRPEIFFSGALHGDERVGPQAAMALAEMLAQHAADPVDGIAWLRRLVQTRTVVIMPTTNAYGYDRNKREEKSIDPNRDFPYLQRGSRCFQSMAARAVNEVWRAHLFQLAITWHAGTTSISYQWGSTNHAILQVEDAEPGGSEVSPDDRGQFLIAKGLSRYGGKFVESEGYYPTGRMNDIVYAVEGGMEDWAYAGSWESGPMGTCSPKSYGGYDSSKSVYGNATHRAFNILIETSDDKKPSEWYLGDRAALSESALMDFLPYKQTVGHVARNVRLALYYIDILQPYVVWKSSSGETARAGNATEFTWEVAGAITVNRTQLTVSTSPNMTNTSTTTTTTTPSQSGVTRWYHPDMELSLSTAVSSNKGLFTESVVFPTAGVYYVQASAVVDQNWADQPQQPTPSVRPQSHIVNARTNPQWLYEANNKTVQGKLVWRSPVLEVVVQ